MPAVPGQPLLDINQLQQQRNGHDVWCGRRGGQATAPSPTPAAAETAAVPVIPFTTTQSLSDHHLPLPTSETSHPTPKPLPFTTVQGDSPWHELIENGCNNDRPSNSATFLQMLQPDQRTQIETELGDLFGLIQTQESDIEKSHRFGSFEWGGVFDRRFQTALKTISKEKAESGPLEMIRPSYSRQNQWPPLLLQEMLKQDEKGDFMEIPEYPHRPSSNDPRGYSSTVKTGRIRQRVNLTEVNSFTFLQQKSNHLMRRQFPDAAGYPDCSYVGNGVLSCYPKFNTHLIQNVWSKFIWNSRYPTFIGAGTVDIYLYHADSETIAKIYLGVENARGMIGILPDDDWLPVQTSWTYGKNLTLPYFFVIVDGNSSLTGGEPHQSTFELIQTQPPSTLASSLSSSSASSLAAAAAAESATAALLSTSPTLTSSVSGSLSSTPSAGSTPSSTGLGTSISNSSSSSARGSQSTLQPNGKPFGSGVGPSIPSWAIALIAVLGFLALASGILATYFCFGKLRRREKMRSDTNTATGTPANTSPIIDRQMKGGTGVRAATALGIRGAREEKQIGSGVIRSDDNNGNYNHEEDENEDEEGAASNGSEDPILGSEKGGGRGEDIYKSGQATGKPAATAVALGAGAELGAAPLMWERGSEQGGYNTRPHSFSADIHQGGGGDINNDSMKNTPESGNGRIDRENLEEGGPITSTDAAMMAEAFRQALRNPEYPHDPNNSGSIEV